MAGVVDRARLRPWIAPVALYAAAFLARAFFLGSAPYGDEAHHYFIARGFGTPPPNLLEGQDTHWLFWWRPLFSLLLAAGAHISFTAFRLDYILLSSLLAPGLYLWVRARGGGRWAGGAAGLVAALHPFFVIWGVRAFPDELMAALFVLGLVAWEHRRVWLGAGLLLAATWVKEVALVGIAALLAAELVERFGRDGAAWALRLQPRARHLLLVGALAFAWAPHWVANSMGGRAPGWSRGGTLVSTLDGTFTTMWFVPFVLVGLFVPRARRPALLALAFAGFYLAYNAALGGATELWYNILPAALATAVVALVCEQMARSAAPALRRMAPTALAVVLVAAQLLLPGTSDLKMEALHPGTTTRELSVAEAIDLEQTRDRDLWTLVEAAHGTDWHAVFLVDVPWFFAYWPFSERADVVGSYFTKDNPASAAQWAAVIETIANMTVLKRTDGPLNLALQETYASCVGLATPEYLLIRGMGCKGNATALDAAWARHKV